MKKYKLIKEYPGSPKLGTILIKKSNGWYELENSTSCANQPNIIENNPEFWEDVFERDYEILSFKGNSNSPQIGIAFKSKINGLFVMGSETKEGKTTESRMLKLGYNIHSVKRLSDGEVFSVGDKVTFYESNTEIESIYFNEHNQLSFKVKGDKAPLTGVFGRITHLKKMKEPLFKSEDGVDIYEGDKVFKVNRNMEISEFFALSQKDRRLFMRFSTKEAAEEYILMNKPCLSLTEIAIIYKGINKKTNHPSSQANQLKNLVKQKLKI